MMSLLSPGEAIDYFAKDDPDTPALTDRNGTLTRSELAERSRIIAAAMLESKASEGRLMPLALTNGVDLFVAAVAALRIGAIPMPISPKLALLEREAILKLADAPLVIEEGDAVLAAQGAVFEGNVAPPMLKASTSGGSTGRPKIILSKLPVCFDPTETLFGMPMGSTHLVVAPCSNSGPFTLSLLALLRGTHLVIEPRFDAERTLMLIERHKVAFVFMVPTMMARILALPEERRDRYDLSALRMMAHAGAKCGEQLKRQWLDWMGPDRVEEFYAGTEAQGSTWINGREWLSHPGSVGKPSGGCAIRIRDDESRDLPPGEVGEIFMRPAGGPGSTYAYIGAEPVRAEDGFESIGDLGRLDEEGYLYIADRRHDLILRGGTNIYPAEVEIALETHPKVRAAVAIGLPDPELGQRVHALIEAAEPIDEAELEAHAAHALSAHKRPASYEIVDQPLRDEGGKVRRSRFAERRLAPQSGESA